MFFTLNWRPTIGLVWMKKESDVNIMNGIDRIRGASLRMLIPLLVSATFLVGCSKGGGPGSENASKAFAAAPAEVKQLWLDGLGAWKGGHYAQAATNFVALNSRADSFSKEQADELANAMGAFGREAMIASGKGSSDADEALNTLRSTGGRRK
jgi:hypothetical protein